MKWEDVIKDKRYLEATPEEQAFIQADWFKHNIESDPRYMPEEREMIWVDIFGEREPTITPTTTEMPTEPEKPIEIPELLKKYKEQRPTIPREPTKVSALATPQAYPQATDIPVKPEKPISVAELAKKHNIEPSKMAGGMAEIFKEFAPKISEEREKGKKVGWDYTPSEAYILYLNATDPELLEEFSGDKRATAFISSLIDRSPIGVFTGMVAPILGAKRNDRIWEEINPTQAAVGGAIGDLISLMTLFKFVPVSGKAVTKTAKGISKLQRIEDATRSAQTAEALIRTAQAWGLQSLANDLSDKAKGETDKSMLQIIEDAAISAGAGATFGGGAAYATGASTLPKVYLGRGIAGGAAGAGAEALRGGKPEDIVTSGATMALFGILTTPTASKNAKIQAIKTARKTYDQYLRKTEKQVESALKDLPPKTRAPIRKEFQKNIREIDKTIHTNLGKLEFAVANENAKTQAIKATRKAYGQDLRKIRKQLESNLKDLPPETRAPIRKQYQKNIREIDKAIHKNLAELDLILESGERLPKDFNQYVNKLLNDIDNTLISQQHALDKGIQRILSEVTPKLKAPPPKTTSVKPVGKPEIKTGDKVQWTSGGVKQFTKPKSVTGFSEDGKFVFVEGSKTGLPIDQVNVEKLATGVKPEISALQTQIKQELGKKYPIAIQQKNSIKEHLGTETVASCKDIDKLTTYLEYLKSKPVAKEKVEPTTDTEKQIKVTPRGEEEAIRTDLSKRMDSIVAKLDEKNKEFNLSEAEKEITDLEKNKDRLTKGLSNEDKAGIDDFIARAKTEWDKVKGMEVEKPQPEVAKPKEPVKPEVKPEETSQLKLKTEEKVAKPEATITKEEMPKELKVLAESIKNYKNVAEFRKAYTQSHLMDLSNPEMHRWGRALAPYKDAPHVDIPQIISDGKYPGSYLTTIKYEYPQIYRSIVSPSDKITVYRAVPEDKAGEGIQIGDYVALDREYAQMHLTSVLEGEQGIKGKIISNSVPKSDIIWGNADFREWVYSPKKIRDYAGSLEEFYETVNSQTAAKGVKPEETIPIELEPLAKEARKYKSAKEFVEAQDRIGRIIPVSEDAEYSGQEMQWTEDMTKPRKAKEDIIVYHYSDRKIKSFFPKIIATTTNPKLLGHVYAIKINKGDYIQHSPGLPPEDYITEVRIRVTPQTKIQYIGEIKEKGRKVAGNVRYIDKEENIIEPTFEPLTKSQLTDIWNKAQIKPQATKEIKEVKPEAKPEVKPIPKEKVVEWIDKKSPSISRYDIATGKVNQIIEELKANDFVEISIEGKTYEDLKPLLEKYRKISKEKYPPIKLVNESGTYIQTEWGLWNVNLGPGAGKEDTIFLPREIAPIAFKPEARPEVKAEKSAIPKELEPLAKEARKYKSFDDWYASFTGKNFSNDKFLIMQDAFYGAGGKWDITLGSSTLSKSEWREKIWKPGLKSFYTQATKGVKEVKPEVKPTEITDYEKLSGLGKQIYKLAVLSKSGGEFLNNLKSRKITLPKAKKEIGTTNIGTWREKVRKIELEKAHKRNLRAREMATEKRAKYGAAIPFEKEIPIEGDKISIDKTFRLISTQGKDVIIPKGEEYKIYPHPTDETKVIIQDGKKVTIWEGDLKDIADKITILKEGNVKAGGKIHVYKFKPEPKRPTLSEEQIKEMRKMRKKIGALAYGIKGMSKAELHRIVQQVTGLGKLNNQKMTPELLSKVYQSVQRTRPKVINHKVVIKPKTEKQIKSLKDELSKEGQITDESFRQILNYLHISPIFTDGSEFTGYIDGKKFLTQKQGREIIRAMLQFAELTEITNKNQIAIEKNPILKDFIDKINEGYAEKRKLIETEKEIKYAKIKNEVKKENFAKLLRKAQIGKPATLLNTYNFFNLMEERTGKPFGEVYAHVAEQKQLAHYEYEQEWNGLIDTVGEKKFYKIWSDRKAMRRIEDYVASFMPSYMKKVPPMPKDITADEKKLAEYIRGHLKNWENFVRQERFYQWLDNPEIYSIPNAPEKDLKKAVNILESSGDKKLREYLDTRKWGIRRSGYDIGYVISPKIRGYTTKPDLSKAHLSERKTIVYQSYERDIFSRFRTYTRSMTNRKYLGKPIKAMKVLLNTNMDLFDAESANRIADMFERNIVELLEIRPKRTWAVNAFLRTVSQVMKTTFSILPYKGVRNLHQNLAFKTGFDIRKLKKLDKKQLEFFEKRISQEGGIHRYFLVEQFPPISKKILAYLPLPIPLKWQNELADKINVMVRSDKLNRTIDYQMTLGALKAAEKEYPNWLKNKDEFNKFLIKIGFGDITAKNGQRCIEKLATEGIEAFENEFSFYVVLREHFPYNRFQRAPVFQGGDLELVLSNLLSFRRGYIERIMMDVKRLGKTETKIGKDYKSRRRAIRSLIQLMVMSSVADYLLYLITGKEERPYDPVQIATGVIGLGGLHVGVLELMGDFSWELSKTLGGEPGSLTQTLLLINQAGSYTLPLYKLTWQSMEAMLGYKNLDKAIYRQIGSAIEKEYEARGLDYYKEERNLREAIQHGLFKPYKKEEKEKEKKKLW